MGCGGSKTAKATPQEEKPAATLLQEPSAEVKEPAAADTSAEAPPAAAAPAAEVAATQASGEAPAADAAAPKVEAAPATDAPAPKAEEEPKAPEQKELAPEALEQKEPEQKEAVPETGAMDSGALLLPAEDDATTKANVTEEPAAVAPLDEKVVPAAEKIEVPEVAVVVTSAAPAGMPNGCMNYCRATEVQQEIEVQTD